MSDMRQKTLFPDHQTDRYSFTQTFLYLRHKIDYQLKKATPDQKLLFLILELYNFSFL